MKKTLLTAVLVLVFSLFCLEGSLDAESQYTRATVKVEIPSYVSISLGTKADETQIEYPSTEIFFGTIDSKDMPEDPNNSGTMMYAPVRSLGLNWHFVKVVSTDPNWSIEAELTTSPSGIPSDRFKFWFGGGWRGNEQQPVNGLGKSTDWEVFGTEKSTSDGAGEIKCYYSYQVNIEGIEVGTYAGGVVTFTVTTS